MTATGITCSRTSNSRGRPLGTTALEIREAILDDLVVRYDRMTVRQVFYQLEVKGVVRRPRAIPAGADPGARHAPPRAAGLVVHHRWNPVAAQARDLGLEGGLHPGRRPLLPAGPLARPNYRIEFWLEKDALADIVADITNAWDVSLMVSPDNRRPHSSTRPPRPPNGTIGRLERSRGSTRCTTTTPEVNARPARSSGISEARRCPGRRHRAGSNRGSDRRLEPAEPPRQAVRSRG